MLLWPQDYVFLALAALWIWVGYRQVGAIARLADEPQYRPFMRTGRFRFPTVAFRDPSCPPALAKRYDALIGRFILTSVGFVVIMVALNRALNAASTLTSP